MSKKYSLFVCLTPLQMKIAKRIIEIQSIQNYKLVGLFLSQSKKYDHYFDLLKHDCEDFYIYYPKNGVSGFSALKDVYNFKKGLYKSGILKDVNQIFLAAIDNRYFQLIVSGLSKVKIYTFDDGYANLNYNGSYYKSGIPNLMKKLIWWLVGVKVFTINIRNLTQKHYTIYPNKKNISKELSFVSLMEFEKKYKAPNKKINIFLGQPLYEVNSKADDCYINNLLEKLKVDLYMPHPRENYVVKNNNLKIVNTNLICEDYVINLLAENYEVNLFSFFSTTLLNFLAFERVGKKVIYDPNLFGDECYEVLKDENLSLLDYRDLL